MKCPLFASLLALVLGAAALVTTLVNSRSLEPRESDPVLPVVAGPDADLLARVEALGDEIRTLRDRLAMLELRPAPVPRAPVMDGLASKEELDALRAEVRQGLARRDVLPVESPAFREHVAGTLAEIRKEEAVERVRAYQDERAERLEEDVARIEEWLDLTSAQSSRMETALLTQYKREAEVRRLWEEGVDDEVVGEQKRSAGEQFYNDLAEFLTVEQLETFWTKIAGGGK